MKKSVSNCPILWVWIITVDKDGVSVCVCGGGLCQMHVLVPAGPRQVVVIDSCM